ncbi:proteoglycan 4 isoform X2 [Agrilus planipennis]|uniref:Proteoglycan 4 isoform X2 n=1 Tax=Agrilus planipennis TaxID=224129 RepID=A0A1W4X4W5_AGRPL|nr:proteoglycan 4 isoform X2 [Agrilus planipennis]
MIMEESTYSFSNSKENLNNDRSGEEEQLVCKDCDALFTSKHHLLNHLLHHIKQPRVALQRLYQVPTPPLKITLKSKDNNSFEVVRSPQLTDVTAEEYFKLHDTPPSSIKEEFEPTTNETEGSEPPGEGETSPPSEDNQNKERGEEIPEINYNEDEELPDDGEHTNEEETKVTFSPNFAKDIDSWPAESETNEEQTQKEDAIESNKGETLGSTTPDMIPGAEPTPPPEPVEYPKIRIKTTGLLKESLTITEITDDNNSFRQSEIVDVNRENHGGGQEVWPTPSLEDPLRLPENSEKDDGNILTTFLNSNNDKAKDFGLSSSDSEFISLDRLDDRNRNALQVYNPQNSVQNSLESLTGLPMQQLAQQVSRLQPSGSNNGMHQQNVLINIQQFPQAPPQPPPHSYQPPPMYPPHPGMQPPMYQPYQYQPNMYYPPQPNYPSHHMPPPPPNQMQQPPQPQPPPTSQMQPMTTQPMHPNQPSQYRQPVPQRAPAPRQYGPQTTRGPAPPRQPMATRQRAPTMRPRVAMNTTTSSVRGPRPRIPGPTSGPRQGLVQNNQQGNRVIKRSPEQMQMLQAKKRRMDMLLPDKNDDPDCQGGTSDPGDNSVMHLSDSITLSVRNPPKQEQQPKKSDAKAVANILATRGITVTAAPKPKEKQPQTKGSPPPPPVAINLNSAVSIIPTAKNGNDSPKKVPDSRLPTVDLTDDSVPDPKPSQQQTNKGVPSSPQKGGNPRANSASLPHRCDLCPAQYPTPMGLSKHRQSYHKTGGPCEIGVPLVDLKNPGVLQKLSALGIYNYIPLPGSNTDGCFALPVVSLNAAKNPNVCNLNGIGASSILTLGPVRSLPRATPPNGNTNLGK